MGGVEVSNYKINYLFMDTMVIGRRNRQRDRERESDKTKERQIRYVDCTSMIDSRET